MKVYFNASLAGKKNYGKAFEIIIKTIKSLGHKTEADHVMARNYSQVNKQTREEHEYDFKKAREQIQESDVMIVEATYPSIGVGHTMTLALEMYKSVLVLYQTTPHGLLIGNPNRLLIVKRYNPKESQGLKNIVKRFLKNSEERSLKKRFNLIINKGQNDYLQWAAKKQVISKSNLIRQLIDKNLHENKEYLNTTKRKFKNSKNF